MKAKKVMALALAAVLLVATSVAATIAYLTDSDKAVNTFTVGKVYIDLIESDVDEDGNTKANKYHLQPGLTYDKDPTVTVLKGSEECYVRVLVKVENIEQLKNAFPAKNFDYSKWNIKNWYGADGVFLLQNLVDGWDKDVWKYAGYNNGTYEFRYVNPVAKNEQGDTVLPTVFTKVVVPGEIDNDHLAYIQNAKITVTAHAIQAAGFANADAAWAAFK